VRSCEGLDGPVAHVLAGGVLTRTIACPVPDATRARLRGARPGSAQPPRLPQPLTVKRRVSVRGAIMAGGRRSRSASPTPARPRRSPWAPTPTRSPPGTASPSPPPAPPAATSGGTKPPTTAT